MGTVLALAVAALAFGAGASAKDEPGRSDRGQGLPTEAPLATVGGFASVTRLDPVTLGPTGPRAKLGEYHDAYSFSPDGSQIAFGISAPSSAGGGRVGIRLVDSRELTIAGNISTGVYAAAVAWLEPNRLVALLGDSFTFGPCPAPPCELPEPEDPDHSTVVSVNPATGQVLERSRVPHSCDTAEVRGQALLSLSGRRLSIVGSDGGVETVRLPRPFAGCGEIATAPSGEQAFVVAEGGGAIAEIALADSRLTVHDFPRRLAGEVAAVGLNRRRVLLARRGRRGQPHGLRLLDIEAQSQRTIDRSAGEARVSGRTLLAFEGRPFARGRGIGVRGYRLPGHRRFRLLGGRHIAKVEPAGRFAYAIGRSGVAVIDARSGTVVTRSRSRFHGDLLSEPSGP